ncbi:hypothetical protein [Herbaspirillum sp. B65]|uniref:hypothetical protein n=1 Tax=Herbaspirillum sp. B65 TaxID=137708 RepID=UPI00034D6873|nr:hypothetical protein [Herbaspirillum sp. B65]
MTDYFFDLPTSASSLSVYSDIERYDPTAPRDFRPFSIGEFVIRRLPLRGALYTDYYILHEGAVIGHQISFPSEEDCRMYQRRQANLRASIAQQAPAVEAPLFGDVVLQGRIAALLGAGGEMDTTSVAYALRMQVSTISPVLEKMANEHRIYRRGTRHRYTYRAA